ncbi:MAG: DsbA family protein [Deltaproteobacteria bacterium]|nr:DsbA family protein [Deltaproteobacteria bacterium]
MLSTAEAEDATAEPSSEAIETAPPSDELTAIVDPGIPWTEGLDRISRIVANNGIDTRGGCVVDVPPVRGAPFRIRVGETDVLGSVICGSMEGPPDAARNAAWIDGAILDEEGWLCAVFSKNPSGSGDVPLPIDLIDLDADDMGPIMLSWPEQIMMPLGPDDPPLLAEQALVDIGRLCGRVQCVLALDPLVEAAIDERAARREEERRARWLARTAAATHRVALGDARTWGKDTALLTVVLWADMSRPGRSSERALDLVEALRDRYGDEIRVAFKHYPPKRSVESVEAAVAAEAAGRQGRFWDMHGKIVAGGRPLNRESFVAWARELGLKTRRFKRDLDDPVLRERVDNQRKEAERLQVRTYGTFINGRYLRHGLPQQDAEAVAQQEFERAQALVDSGVPAAEVYPQTIAAGLEHIEWDPPP